MKIEIEVPDWVANEGRGLFIMAGIEPVALKFPGQPWKIKVSRCTSCGKCCEGYRDSDEFPVSVDGRCIYLKDEGQKKVCSVGLSRPFGCCIASNNREGCTVTWQ